MRGRSAPPPTGWRVEHAPPGGPRASARPHPLLRGLLARDYVGVPRGAEPHRLLIPATAAVPLVVKVCDSPHRPAAFLYGVHDHYTLMDGDCAPSYLSVWMAPLGAYRLLGRPVGELGDTVVDARDVFGADGRRLAEALRQQPTWRQRFALVDRFLLMAAQRGPRPSDEVARAWRVLVDTHGTTPIGRIADEVGWSHKHLIARFTQQVGLTPKTAARLVRLDRVLARVRAGRMARWDQVAAEGGYADQAHLIRDFRAFTGITPTDYVARIGR